MRPYRRWPDAAWTDSESARRALAESGVTVLANGRRDHALIAWARQTGRYVYIGRDTRHESGPYGNPFLIGRDGDRDAVVGLYRVHVLPTLDLTPLRGGKVLCCWCTPERCHGDVILEALAESSIA